MRAWWRQERPADDVRPVWAACAALLDYPTPELLASLDAVEALVPGHLGLRRVIAHLRDTDLIRLQQEYVETFDHTRKCSPYLTYFGYGDTRRRGVALVQFKQAYRRGGVDWDESCQELPDHLCAVLQFGAAADPGGAWHLLNDHRAGVEMLRLALAAWDDGAGSPWLGVVEAVCATLPELRGEDADAVRRLVEQGPPAEAVGLQPYALDPSLLVDVAAPRPPADSEFLGMPR